MTAMHTISNRTVALSDLWLEIKGWINPREFSGLDAESIAEMGSSIKTKGIVEPPKVAQIQIGKDHGSKIVDLVVDGQRRVLGARDVLAKSAPIPVVDLFEDPIVIDNLDEGLSHNQTDALLIRAFTTLEREGLSSYELVQAAHRWKQRGKTGEWIAKIISRSPSWVSKMLKARETASPALLLKWRKEEITDEQFKDLAEVKDPEKQTAAIKEVVDARKSGDVTEARVRAKEIKETERVTNGHTKRPAPVTKPAVSGGQLTLDGKEETETGKPEKSAPPKPRSNAPNKLVLQEMIDVADKRPPTSDYVKGLVDGVRYAMGAIEPQEFGKAWQQYVSRIHGAASGKAKARKPPKRNKSTRAKRSAKKSSGRSKRK